LMKRLKRKDLKILNIGAGIGINLDILNKFGEVYIIDINQQALDMIPVNLYKEKKICDVTNLLYPDNYFDVICSFDVFEHVRDDFKAISEVYRALKKDGFLLFTVPAFQFLFSAHDKALCHFRRYNKRSIQNLLIRFKNIKIIYWNTVLFFAILPLRILKKKSEPRTDYFDLPIFIETFFTKLLSFENHLIEKGVKLPIGLSIVGYCRK